MNDEMYMVLAHGLDFKQIPSCRFIDEQIGIYLSIFFAMRKK